MQDIIHIIGAGHSGHTREHRPRTAATAQAGPHDPTQPRPTVSSGDDGGQQRWRRRCNGHTLQTSGQWSSVRHGFSWGGGGRETGSGALRPTAW